MSPGSIQPSLSASDKLFETLFHASTLDLVVPNTPALISPPPDGKDHAALSAWWEAARAAEQRQTAFFDERLAYVLGLTLSDELVDAGRASGSKSTPPDLVRYISRLQVSLSASFLPALNIQQNAAPNDRQSIGIGAAPGSTSSLAPPGQSPRPQTPVSGEPKLSLPPNTPNPFPSMSADESAYANVEGISVWEGSPSDSASTSNQPGSGTGSARPEVFHANGAWTILWRGEVPIAYVRTPIAAPVLGITASVTMREQSVVTRKRGMSIETASVHSDAETVKDGANAMDVDEGIVIDDLAGFDEIDLLSGLASEPMPTTRLAPSLRAELSLPAQPSSTTAPLISPSTSAPVPLSASPSIGTGSSMTVLRKSFRRIFSLSSGLRVRMRTLFLPQLLPPKQPYTSTPSDFLGNIAQGADDAGADHEGEGERRVVLCVEVENVASPAAPNGQGAGDDLTRFGFEVERVGVDVGGKGGRATAELTCQPEEESVFPLRLAPLEQYNLLYAVSLASGHEAGALDEAIARSTGRGDEQRPVSITLIGRPFTVILEKGQLPHEGTFQYPTTPFQSRWNCTLDLAPLYASLPSAPLHATSPSARPRPPPPAIAGDRRYSLAALLSDKDSTASEPSPAPTSASSFNTVTSGATANANSNRRIVSAQQKPQPMLPSQNMGNRVASLRAPLTLPPSRPDGHGLLVSVQIIAPPTASFAHASAGPNVNGFSQTSSGIRAFDTFSIEVFVNNRTELPRRFNLSIPPKDATDTRVREAWRRRRQESASLADDQMLQILLAQHTSLAPALVPLETDVRCGPLLPGASLSARIRFLALRDGVHRIDRLRVIGEDFDFVVSPVVEVVVGSGRG